VQRLAGTSTSPHRARTPVYIKKGEPLSSRWDDGPGVEVRFSNLSIVNQAKRSFLIAGFLERALGRQRKVARTFFGNLSGESAKTAAAKAKANGAVMMSPGIPRVARQLAALKPASAIPPWRTLTCEGRIRRVSKLL
jgi:hypothetical protein